MWPSVPVPCHNGVAQPHGPPGPRHVPNGVHAVSYGGHRNRPEAARCGFPATGGVRKDAQIARCLTKKQDAPGQKKHQLSQ